MRRSEAARYARWSAAVALVLAGVTTAVYLKRDWVRHIERKKAPPPAPLDVTRQSSGITFKKFGEQNHVIFEVTASKSTEFKGQDVSLLEEVQITIFGKAGDRHIAMSADKIVLKGEVALRAVHDGAHGIIAHRQHPRSDAEPPAEIGGDVGEAWPARGNGYSVLSLLDHCRLGH